jgi:hypothetical protein
VNEEKEILSMLTRSMLKGMGLTDEQVSAIIEAHTETTDALKESRDKYKEDAEKLPEVQKELDKLKANPSEADDWKGKYETEHKAFEDYKKDLAAADAKKSKQDAYRALLKEIGVSENRIDSILKITNVDEFKIKDGKFEDSDKMKEAAKNEWKDFITSQQTQGADTKTPPQNDDGGSDYEKMSMADYAKAREGK